MGRYIYKNEIQNILWMSLHAISSFTNFSKEVNDVKLLEVAQTQGIDEKSSAQDQKILDIIDTTNENGISDDLQEPNLPIKQASKTLKASHNQEILW